MWLTLSLWVRFNLNPTRRLMVKRLRDMIYRQESIAILDDDLELTEAQLHSLSGGRTKEDDDPLTEFYAYPTMASIVGSATLCFSRWIQRRGRQLH